MTQLNEIYKCQVCGNIVEVIHASSGNLVCCSQPMLLLMEKIHEEGEEKHVPVVKKLKNKIRVKIGSKEHPMLPDHYIEFIELIVDGLSFKKFLKPGDKPRAEFCVVGENVVAREYCNVHGLWKN